MVAAHPRPEHSGKHLNKQSLLQCPEQSQFRMQAGEDGGRSACSTEERWLPQQYTHL